ncbi:MAG: ABC transporter [Bacteroidetes bacterium CG23_combo_of_CG06-09_8_20_14_all_32_9]|nr:MAG: ABC transporter [Bacteroidetes bacterium CG23_combo_of_CG06-09_8_20_14_all_32_9]
MLLIRLIKESFLSAVSALVVNKMRTFLSLLGITIGIFTIISVFTVIDSMKSSIRSSIESLGNNVIYIQKWPWEFSSDYQWWKYLNRPVPTLKETQEIQSRSTKAETVAFVVSSSKTIEYRSNSIDNVSVISATQDYDKIRSFEIEKGRYFSFFESNNGSAKAIIGSTVAKSLFKNINPVGREIKIMGGKINVLGVFKKEGNSVFDESLDNAVLIPVSYARNIFNIRDEEMNPVIMVRAARNVDIAELTDDLRNILRAIRRLRPVEEDDFALNQASLITQGFEQVFQIVDLAGLLIGGLAIFVGGFGIANIMFVSVKERTKLIGIQKSLGAKNHFILVQFLSESVLLSLIGGIIGLLLVYIGTVMGTRMADMKFSMSFGNILSGILISVVIGIASGLAPALSASKLNPVDAINSNF